MRPKYNLPFGKKFYSTYSGCLMESTGKPFHNGHSWIYRCIVVNTLNGRRNIHTIGKATAVDEGYIKLLSNWSNL